MLYRLENGEKRMADKVGGCFILGDPRYGKYKHRNENAVRERSEAVAAELIRDKGFSLRVQPLAAKSHAYPGLVRKDIFWDDVRLTGTNSR